MLETTIAPANEVERIVLDLFNGMGPDIASFKATFRDMLAEDAVWEAVGWPPRIGRDACVAYIDELHARTGVTHCTIRVRALASNATLVFSERDDLIMLPDGTPTIKARVCGVVEVKNGKVSRYSDYLDLSSMRPPAAA